MSLRIAVISENASPLSESNAQATHVAHLVRNLAAMGQKVDVFTRRTAAQQPLITQWLPNVRVVHVPVGPVQPDLNEDYLVPVPLFIEFMEAFIRNEGLGYDMMHAHYWLSGMVAHHLKKIFGIPFVITFHGLGRLRRLHQTTDAAPPAIRLRIEESLAAEADHVIAECPQDKDDIIRFCKGNPKNITVLPSGVDPLEIWPVEKNLARVVLGLPQKESLLLHMGHLTDRNGVETILQTMKLLVNEHHADAKLLLVGGRPAQTRWGERADELGISYRVMFRGPCSRDELKYYYSSADALISMPWYEPFGLSPLEAMACGTPVIGSDVGGIKFMVQDHRTGFLVPPMNAEALAARTAYLLERPPMATIIGKFGRLRVLERFTWRKVAKATLYLYQLLLQREWPALSIDTGLSGIDATVFDQWKETREPVAAPKWY